MSSTTKLPPKVLMDLPVELIVKILEELLVIEPRNSPISLHSLYGWHEYEGRFWYHAEDNIRRFVKKILHTCRLFRTEGEKIFYSQNTFDLPYGTGFESCNYYTPIADKVTLQSWTVPHMNGVDTKDYYLRLPPAIFPIRAKMQRIEISIRGQYENHPTLGYTTFDRAKVGLKNDLSVLRRLHRFGLMGLRAVTLRWGEDLGVWIGRGHLTPHVRRYGRPMLSRAARRAVFFRTLEEETVELRALGVEVKVVDSKGRVAK